MEGAKADAERIRLIGGAEAKSIEAVGKAEAERMRLKASAYKQYGDAAMLSLVLETLPKVRPYCSATTAGNILQIRGFTWVSIGICRFNFFFFSFKM